MSSQTDSPVKPRIFIGSSTQNLGVARAVKECLDGRHFDARTWEGLFKQNESTLDGLIRVTSEVDFAVFIWGPSDLTVRDGEMIPSARDNVVFETGQFLGSLGKENTFIIADRSVKIPTDFNGITRSFYDDIPNKLYDIASVSNACNAIERSIRDREIPAHLARLQGNWRSRFASGPLIGHPVIVDTVEMTVMGKRISLKGTSGNVSYTGEANVYSENQVIGQWNHHPHPWMAKGSFMLMVSPTADSMYGYSTTQDADGKPIFGTWVFTKADGSTDGDTLASLIRGQKSIKALTISPPASSY